MTLFLGKIKSVQSQTVAQVKNSEFQSRKFGRIPPFSLPSVASWRVGAAVPVLAQSPRAFGPNSRKGYMRNLKIFRWEPVHPRQLDPPLPAEAVAA